MVDIDDDLAHAERSEARKGDFQQGASANFDECFGALIRQWAQARAEACG